MKAESKALIELRAEKKFCKGAIEQHETSIESYKHRIKMIEHWIDKEKKKLEKKPLKPDYGNGYRTQRD